MQTAQAAAQARVTPLRVGILGAGRMASRFDAPGAPMALSLANAVRLSPHCELGGFYDIADGRAEAAEERWGCPPTPRSREAWLDHGWDIIVIATASEAHAQDMRDSVARKPRAILLEKPVAADPCDGVYLLRAAADAAVPVLVDYPRRWHSGVRQVADQIRSGAVGTLRAINVVVSGGMHHNGVHFLDLFHGWWDADYGVRELARGARTTVLEFSGPAGDFVGSFIEAPVDDCYVWDINIFCSAAQIRLGGRPEQLVLSRLQSDPVIDSFTVLRPSLVFEIDREPLLSRALDRLVTIANDPAVARTQLEYEISVQSFMSRVLPCFERAQR